MCWKFWEKFFDWVCFFGMAVVGGVVAFCIYVGLYQQSNETPDFKTLCHYGIRYIYSKDIGISVMYTRDGKIYNCSIEDENY
jgi:hypothetical protein